MRKGSARSGAKVATVTPSARAPAPRAAPSRARTSSAAIAEADLEIGRRRLGDPLQHGEAVAQRRLLVVAVGADRRRSASRRSSAMNAASGAIIARGGAREVDQLARDDPERARGRLGAGGQLGGQHIAAAAG